MKTKTAALIVGGIVAGTITVGVVSLLSWSIVPMSIWGISCGVVGSQTMNVLRVRSGQLQPAVRAITNHPKK